MSIFFRRYGNQRFGTGFKRPNWRKRNKGKPNDYFPFFGKKSILVELNRYEEFVMFLMLEPHSFFSVFDS